MACEMIALGAGDCGACMTCLHKRISWKVAPPNAASSPARSLTSSSANPYSIDASDFASASSASSVATRSGALSLTSTHVCGSCWRDECTCEPEPKQPKPKTPDKKIKRNSAICLICDTEVESKHRHDWVQCVCTNMFVDGGKDYLRRGAKDLSTIKDTSEYEEE